MPTLQMDLSFDHPAGLKSNGGVCNLINMGENSCDIGLEKDSSKKIQTQVIMNTDKMECDKLK